MTAYTCAGLGLSVILLEAERVGAAMAGQGAGLLLPDPVQGFMELASLVGRRRARYSFDSWRHGALDAAATLRRLKISCDLRPLRLLTAVTGSSLRELEREMADRRAAEVAGSWLTSGPASRAVNRRADGALVHGAAFGFQPFKACIGVARAAVRRGALCFEHSRVRRLRAEPRAVELTLKRGTVRAQTVIVATGEATAEFPALQRHFVGRERYLVHTGPVSAVLRRKLMAPGVGLSDGRRPPLRAQWTPDRCVLLTGGDQVLPRKRQVDTVLQQRTGQLMYEFLTTYPDNPGTTDPGLAAALRGYP